MITTLLALALAADPAPKGHLVVAGGGGTAGVITKRTLELAGGPSARVLVMPQASSVSDGSSSVKMWREMGATEISVLNPADPAAARKAIAAADLIWMPGGDQSRLMDALTKADLVAAVRDRYRAGATVGGTSAGAAVQSGVMIVGGEDAPLDRIRLGATKTVEGIGLWPEAIVDQHFVKRHRFNRLLAAVLDRPKLVGVGIDEATAVVVTGTTFEVIGVGQVVVVDARKATVAPGKKDDLGSATGIALHVLTPGMKFDLGKVP